jgi:UDP-glucose 4-epimerase
VRVFDTVKPLREDVEWFKGDLLNDEDVLRACADVKAVFHLAAVADVNVALSDPEKCVWVNEAGTAKLLKAVVKKEVDRIIDASSTWVYGRTEGVVDENTLMPIPDHIYTKTKIGQEHMIYSWHKHYGMPYTILRYDIPYGPRMRSNMVIAIFVRKAIKNEPITIFGDGEQGRCFIHVEDLAEGNVAALKQNGKNQVFNLAGKEFVTINQIVYNLKQNFGEINVKHGPSPPSDFRGVQVNIEKAKRLLGWEPKTPFQVGLRKYVKYLKNGTNGSRF